MLQLFVSLCLVWSSVVFGINFYWNEITKYLTIIISEAVAL